MITLGVTGLSSFLATFKLTRAANRHKQPVSATILGRSVLAFPGDDPNRLYDGFGSTGRGAVPEELEINIENVERFCA